VEYFQGDNGVNNGTMIRSIAPTLIDQNANNHPEYRRLRSMGHALNLPIKAFWFGDSGSSQELLDVIIVTHETMALWRKLGPWWKVHNITHSSVQRKQQLQTLRAEILRQARNATQWNSGLAMIQSLPRNKEAVNFFCLNNPDLAQDFLSDADWLELESAICILQPLPRSTLRLESKVPNVREVSPELITCQVFTSMLLLFCLYWSKEILCRPAFLISIEVHGPMWFFFTNPNHRDVINRYQWKAHLACAAHLGLAKTPCL